MGRPGLHGVVRGKVIRTTIPDARTPCPLDRVNRQFRASRPNQFWVSGFTTFFDLAGLAVRGYRHQRFHAAHLGWRVSSSMHTDFVRDALEQALHVR